MRWHRNWMPQKTFQFKLDRGAGILYHPRCLQLQKVIPMNTDRAYIKITEEVEDENYSPTEHDLMLDNYSEEEYNNPYGNDSYDDITGNGETFEVGGIFDDR